MSGTPTSYEEYLRMTRKAERRVFSRGYLKESATPQPLAPDVVANASSGVESLVLPPKKRTKRSGNKDAGVAPQTSAVPVQPPVSMPSAPAAPSERTPANPTRPGLSSSLILKYFGKRVLVREPLKLSLSPSLDFVVSVRETASAERQQVVQLRNGLSEIGDALFSLARQQGILVDNLEDLTRDQVNTLVSGRNRLFLLELVRHTAACPVSDTRALKRWLWRLLEYRRGLPRLSSHRRTYWYHYLDVHGPGACASPSMGHLLHMSDSAVTAFTGALARQLLRYAAPEETKDKEGEAGDNPAASRQAPRLYVASEDDDCYNGEEEAEDTARSTDLCNGAAAKGSAAVTVAVPYPESAQGRMILFFQVISRLSATSKSGYGSFLFSCLLFLETPLDPETNGLLSRVFSTCCDHLRLLGECLNVPDGPRGALVDDLLRDASADGYAWAPYTSPQDVTQQDVRAVHSLLIILASFFSFNQNNLIEL